MHHPCSQKICTRRRPLRLPFRTSAVALGKGEVPGSSPGCSTTFPSIISVSYLGKPISWLMRNSTPLRGTKRDLARVGVQMACKDYSRICEIGAG